jgi:hypothetical protein
VHSYEAVDNNVFRPLYLNARSRAPVYSSRHDNKAHSACTAEHEPMMVFLALPACEVHIISSLICDANGLTASAATQTSGHTVEPLSHLYAAEVSGAFAVIRRRRDQAYLLLLNIAVWAEFTRLAVAVQRCSSVRADRHTCVTSFVDDDGIIPTAGLHNVSQMRDVAAYSSCSTLATAPDFYTRLTSHKKRTAVRPACSTDEQ